VDDLAAKLKRHEGLVKTVAEYYRRRAAGRAEFDDLYQAGMLGLMHAARRFEPARGLAFSTYAVRCIKGEIIKELKGSDLIRLPDHYAGEERAVLAGKLQPQALARDARALDLDGVGDVEDRKAAWAARRLEEAEEARGRVEELMRHVDPRQREVVERRAQGETLTAIGADMGVCRERVRQLEVKAHRRMRKAEECAQ
jgi:RNA polymerase sigma factor (sigma-70 family)